MIKKIFLILYFLFPILLFIGVFYISFSFKELANPLIAAGTVGAAVAAVWAIIYLEIMKPYFKCPKLEMKEPGHEPKFIKQAPKIDNEGKLISTDYYINIMLKNTGNRTANNCQPLLIGMSKIEQNKRIEEKNWLSVPLRWAGGEKKEFGTNKIREERNIIPHRPYYFNLGKISTEQPDDF